VRKEGTLEADQARKPTFIIEELPEHLTSIASHKEMPATSERQKFTESTAQGSILREAQDFDEEYHEGNWESN